MKTDDGKHLKEITSQLPPDAEQVSCEIISQNRSLKVTGQ